MASADYARTLGIALRAGRGFTEQDILHAEHVALINQAATRLWPAGESPIGKRLRLDLLVKPAGALLVQPGGSPEVTVVGVLADTRNAGLRNPTVPEVYVPFTLLAPPSRGIAVKAVSKPTLLLNAIRQEVAALDKDQPITRPLTLAEVLEFDTVQPRFNMALFTFFGMLGLALAAVGVFSVLSYVVARRTHEIGIRVALGAERHHVLSLVFAMGGKLVLVGLAAGLAGSYLLAHYLRSEVFEVPATDPLALAGAVVLLCVVALLACYLPARRAARLEPLRALRHE
jgi:putative ABC transport system permease protein